MPEPGQPHSRAHAETDLSSLAVTAMAALYEAGFFEEMEQLRARVLARGAALFDQSLDEDGVWRVAYRPMVELLLLHVRETAVAPRRADDRRREIVWALDHSGF